MRALQFRRYRRGSAWRWKQEIGDVEREVIAKDPFLGGAGGKSARGESAPAKAAESRGATVMVLKDETSLWQTGSGVLLWSKRKTISSEQRV